MFITTLREELTRVEAMEKTSTERSESYGLQAHQYEMDTPEGGKTVEAHLNRLIDIFQIAENRAAELEARAQELREVIETYSELKKNAYL